MVRKRRKPSISKELMALRREVKDLKDRISKLEADGVKKEIHEYHYYYQYGSVSSPWKPWWQFQPIWKSKSPETSTLDPKEEPTTWGITHPVVLSKTEDTGDRTVSSSSYFSTITFSNSVGKDSSEVKKKDNVE